MRNLALIFFLVFTLQVIHLPFAHGSSPCTGALSKIFDSSPSHFDPKIESELKHHSITPLAQRIEAHGIELTFNFDEGKLTTQHPLSLGESAQTKTLSRLLKRIFPTSHVSVGERDLEKYTVRFRVVDSAENGAKVSAKTGMIEMSLMKRASPISPGFTRSAMRAKYKIPTLSQVASLYSTFDNLPALKNLIHSIPENLKPDIWIVSSSFAPEYPAVHSALGNISGYQVIALSELTSRPHFPVGRVLIYNDRTGIMPELYASSNYAVIVGANNLFEPLQGKLPTVFFKSPEFVGKYNSEAFEQMSETAKLTGGAYEVHSERELSQSLLAISKAPNPLILHPAFVKSKFAPKSAFTQLLDQLESAVRARLTEATKP